MNYNYNQASHVTHAFHCVSVYNATKFAAPAYHNQVPTFKNQVLGQRLTMNDVSYNRM